MLARADPNKNPRSVESGGGFQESVLEFLLPRTLDRAGYHEGYQYYYERYDDALGGIHHVLLLIRCFRPGGVKLAAPAFSLSGDARDCHSHKTNACQRVPTPVGGAALPSRRQTMPQALF